MDVEAIIERADEDIAAAEAQVRAEVGRLEEANQRLREAEERLGELRQLKQGFLQAIERYGSQASPLNTPDPELAQSTQNGTAPHPLLASTQVDAVLAALKEIGRPASTAEIYEKLKEAGRPEDAEQVRSTVGYLNRRANRLRRVSRGLWELPSSANTAAKPDASGDGRENGEVTLQEDATATAAG